MPVIAILAWPADAYPHIPHQGMPETLPQVQDADIGYAMAHRSL